MASRANDRGFSPGARQYGFRKIRVPDPSGKKDAYGQAAAMGTRIEVDSDEAKVIRRIFEWAAEGMGLTGIVERLNAVGILGTGGKRRMGKSSRRTVSYATFCRLRRAAKRVPQGSTHVWRAPLPSLP